MSPSHNRILKQGDRIELTIESVAFGGSGVGHSNEMVVFVPFTVDGDTLSAEIMDVKKNFATAALKSVLTPSPFRLKPRCAAYMRCGACSYQHIRYDYQLAIKNRQVADALTRIGKFDIVPFEDILPSSEAYGYRGKADFHISAGRSQNRAIGFAARKTNFIVDLNRCEIVHESINTALSRLRGDRLPAGRFTLWSDQAEEAPETCILHCVKDRKMLVPRNGFFQANLYLIDRLINVVLDFCNLSGKETVLDGYCGSGLFSLFLAPQCARLYGIEMEDDAVRCARENMKRAGFNTATFYQGDMAQLLRKKFMRNNIPVDVTLIDPPRTGLESDTLSALAGLHSQKIVYVSCNPATLARDLRTLADFGYRIKRVQPLDMFPQTSHIETVVLLELTSLF